jgi:glutamate formiminotransferase
VRTDSTRKPDIGGPNLHPTAGASAVGARNYLVGYNVHFKSNDVGAARAIARELRQKNVKALALSTNGRAQLTMNITGFKANPVSAVYETIRSLAKKHRIEIAEGEIVGLIPESACERESEWMRQLVGFEPENKILERRIESPLEWPQP